MTDQKKEIETIKERTLNIKLSDADVKRVWEKAGSVGLSVSELVEIFLGDLVDGTYSNGSDERMYAQQWFDRCGFGMFPDKTFLRFLIEWTCDVEGAVELWNDIKTVKEELAYSETHKEEFTEEEIEGLKEDLLCFEKQINGIFLEYKAWKKDEEIGTLEEEFEKVVKWYDEMKSFMN